MNDNTQFVLDPVEPTKILDSETDAPKLRIALCLHGLAGGTNSKGKKVYADLGAICFRKELLEKYQVDVFCHSWTVSAKENILKWYAPKKYLLENQINFITNPVVNQGMEQIRQNFCQMLLRSNSTKIDSQSPTRICFYCQKKRSQKDFNSDPTKMVCANCYYVVKLYYRNLWSLYHSYYHANLLKSHYEQEQGFKYDLVITSRYDLWLRDICDLSTLDPDKIYFLKYEQKKTKHIIDHLFISSSKNIDQFCDIYLKLSGYTPKLVKKNCYCQYLNHEVIRIALEESGLINQLTPLDDQFPAGALATLNPNTVEQFLIQNCPYVLRETNIFD